MENPIKMDDLGRITIFGKHPYICMKFDFPHKDGSHSTTPVKHVVHSHLGTQCAAAGECSSTCDSDSRIRMMTMTFTPYLEHHRTDVSG